MLKVHARKLDNVSFLCMRGEIVTGETETLRKAAQLHAGSRPEVRTVVLDLAQVRTVDGRGLGVMLELRAQMQAKGIVFKLMNVSKMISRVLEISRLDTVFEVTSAVEFFPEVPRRRLASEFGVGVMRLAPN